MRRLDERTDQLRTYQRQFCRLTFLRKNDGGHEVRCTEADDWEICRVGPAGSLSSYGEQSFTMQETYQRDGLLSLLEQAFERGRTEKAREVRQALEIVK
ncbi:hypothetical protein [Rhizobium sp. SSA_523]|uniref:hypothetical protein n=1 Tax=Rhizobium sp. SSA_523 TaxID=2952477 RepID=UPI002090A4EC|nr:hypothetical protein [Rhizobium sp. SSA_523]MCO5734096.1 hypothetical protein [Rhizobium sp. SSA_523]WKC24734.1 hypothetical protein QTJ18_11955 [Rhizobium sp. SSA_523]